MKLKRLPRFCMILLKINRTGPAPQRFAGVLEKVFCSWSSPARILPPDYHGGPKPAWRERKEKYLNHIREGAGGALRIVLADKLHNIRTMLVDYRRNGDDLWRIFNSGKAGQLWFYQSLVTAFEQGGAHGILFDEFTRTLAEFVDLVGID